MSALTRHALLLLASAGMLLPFVELLVGALRAPAERVARPPVFWPGDPQWGAFARAFEELPLLAWGLNSVIVTFSITLIQLATCSAAGFALAKHDFRGRGLVFRLVLGAQMVPFFLLLIPLFFVMRYWPLAGGNGLVTFDGQGLLGSYAALMLPFTVSWFGIFMMRQYTMAVPDELLDAARVDGASELRLLTLVVLPLVRPGLLTLALFSFVYHWNEYLWTATVTRIAPELQTLPVGIHLLQSAFQTPEDEALRQAALVLSTLPLLVLFTVAQRFYTGAAPSSGLRGVVMADPAEEAKTYEEFLAWADTQEEAYEFVDGKPRPKWPVDPVTGMSGGTVLHHTIQVSVAQALNSRRTPPCRVAVEARLRLTDGTRRIPDVALYCGRADKKDRDLPEPVLLVEVLSATSADYDRGAKLDAYKEIETVREVWLVDSERRRVTVWRRSGREEAPWHADEYIGGTVFASGVLNGEVSLNEIYTDVEL